MFKMSVSSKALLLSGASLIALCLTVPARATTLGGMTGRTAAQIAATVPTTATTSGTTGTNTSVTTAATTTSQSTTDLTTAVTRIKAAMAAQTAAHAAAVSSTATSTVTDGLSTNGLVPDSGLASTGTANAVITWVNADTPTQTTSSSGATTVTVKQTDAKAIANWSSFNIGKNTTVHFDQTAGTASDGSNAWVILNRVSNAVAPSQILGNLKAEGSVYVINNNGVIFGASSQVNTRSLVVSSLNLFSNDLTASNTRFLTGGIGDLNQSNYTTNEVLFTSVSGGTYGDIKIEKGAEITGGSNGLVLMAAPNVTNNGMITVPKGQVALIGGIGVSYDYNAVGLNSGNTVKGTQVTQGYDDGSTTFLRFASYGEWYDKGGNDITPLGSVVNNGLIYTTQGNITLAGAHIVQNGVLAATTSVSVAGSIFLEADYEVGGVGSVSAADTYSSATYYTGTVSFGDGSVTTILASDNGATITNDSNSLTLFDSRVSESGLSLSIPTSGYGVISVVGQTIDFKDGSLVYAPSQTIAVATNIMADPRNVLANSGRVLIEDGAILDASGLADVELSITDNILTVTLGGNELANSPLQQDGILYGSTITVDLRDTGTDATTGEAWVGSDVATLTDYLNLQTKTIQQLMTAGGTINITGSEVIAEKGSTLNVMGGYLHYLGADVSTTKLIDSSGNLVDISKADPLVTYTGIAGQTTDTSTRWGVSTTYTNGIINQGTYESDYIEGGTGGTLRIGAGYSYAANNDYTADGSTTSVNGGALVLASTILASAVSGSYQLSGSDIPSAGTISINAVLPVEIVDPDEETDQNTLAALTTPDGFTASSALLASGGSVYTTNVLSSDLLNASGAANIAISANVSSYGNSLLTVAKGANLTVQNGGSITLTSAAVTVDGTLTAHSGTISITTTPVNGNLINSVNGDLVIGSDAVLDVSGIFANEYLDGADTAGTQYIDGGTIELIANSGRVNIGTYYNPVYVDHTGNITLEAGSLLNLDSGGLVLTTGNLKTNSSGLALGEGGNLTIATYYNGYMVTNPVTASGTDVTTHGIITLEGTIEALGFNGGGDLTIGAVAIQIGGSKTGMASDAFYFDPAYWGDAGFASFTLNAVQEVKVPDNITVTLTHKNLVLDGYVNYDQLKDVASGSNVADYVSAGYLTGTLLTATNLTVQAGSENYSAYGNWTGDDSFYLGKGSSIIADPGAAIKLYSEEMTIVDGSIIAHGGSIELGVNFSTFQGPVGQLYIGPDAVLDVSGVTLLNPIQTQVYTANGWVTPVTGKVLAGGTITLIDRWSPILVAPGATLNVSGTSATLQVVDDTAGSGITGASYTATDTKEWSDAGTVNITLGGGLIFEGTLIGHGGSDEAAGGTLNITTNTLHDGYVPLYLVEDTAAALKNANYQFSFNTYTPKTYLGENGSLVSIFGADTLTGSGFDNFSLNAKKDSIYFAGQVTLNLAGSFIDNGYTLIALSDSAFTVNGASLTVDAGYIALGLQDALTSEFIGEPDSYLANGVVSLHAGDIDIRGFFSFSNVASTTIASDGEIRLLPLETAQYGTLLRGGLKTAGNLTLIGTTIYPATDTLFTITSGGTLTIAYPEGGSASTSTPLSVGGILVLDAVTINQDGELQAPFGEIILGSNGSYTYTDLYGNTTTVTNSPVTTTVNLGEGSVTSVSSNGETLPLGTTIDGETWVYNPYADHQNWYYATNYSDNTAFTLTAAPQGQVKLTGSTVNVASGSTVDLSGGGDVVAAEWISGTGGTYNALTRTSAGTTYAIIPGYSNKTAAYDASNSQTVSAGSTIYISGVSGLTDGWYTLLPASYATQTGAYLVTVTSTKNPKSSQLTTLADGTVLTKATLGNSITGSKSSTGLLVEVQSSDVWKKYSEYTLTSANTFFPTYATKNSLATPYIPLDAGRLVISAKSDFTLNGTFDTDAGKDADGTEGTGAQLDISGNLIEITATDDQVAAAGYTAISADKLDALNFSSILIGGTRSNTSKGTLLTITSNGVLVDNNADHPLTAPEIMLVASPKTTKTSVNINGTKFSLTTVVDGTGQIVLADGSVIKATGSMGTGATNTLILGIDQSSITAFAGTYTSDNSYTEGSALQAYYAAAAKALGSLVRVSTGDAVAVTTVDESLLSPGSVENATTGVSTNLPVLSTGSGVIVNGGATLSATKSLTLASTGDVAVDAGATLSGTEIDASARQITFLGAGATSANGLNINGASLLNLQKSTTVDLQSKGNIVFEGDVDIDMSASDSSLILSGDSLTGDGGAVTITAGTVTLDNELGGSGTFASGSGSLSVNAGEIVFGKGAKTLEGFDSISLTASKGMVGTGSGTMDFGNLDITLKTPILIAGKSSDQTIETTGDLSVVSSGGTAMTSTALGGAITLEGGSVTVAVPVQALAGNITLKATDGDVTLSGTGSLAATGVTTTFEDVIEYNYAGTIKLIAENGTVDLASSSSIDVSGIGGTLGIEGKDVALNGTITATPVSGYTGASFILETGGSVDLDTLVTKLTNAGFDNKVEIMAGQGDLSLSKILTATDVILDAEAGLVTVTGTIDVAGKTGGTIELFGTKGVDLEGKLIATASGSGEDGGTVTLGTSGTFDPANGYNAAYGYENIAASDSGTITIGKNASIDVTGGAATDSNTDTGGTILLRAPLLSDGTVNVSIASGATFTGQSKFTLEPYATWSTTDDSSATGLSKHFDAIIDPAGWYSPAGTLLTGNFYDYAGTLVASYNAATGKLTSVDGAGSTTAYYLENDYFTPTSYNTDHESFYGYVNGTVGGSAGTLMGFIENLTVPVANTGSIKNYQVAPGVELKNPSTAINGGAISVLTNWNLGAEDASGNPLFRTASGIAPIITLRAVGNLNLDASITDGFIQVGNTIYTSTEVIPAGYSTYASVYGSYSSDSRNYSLDAIDFAGLSYDESATALQAPIIYTVLGDTSSTYDTYYAAYQAYVSEWETYYSEGLSYNSGYFTVGGDVVPDDVTALLTAANAKYASVTNLTSYKDYLSTYDSYISAYLDWSFFVYPGSVPLAPLAPSKALALAYVPAIPTDKMPTYAAANSPNVVATAYNQAAIGGMALSNESQSSSYRLVAGAAMSDADPLAVDDTTSGNVTVDGHTLIRLSSSNTSVVGQPTTIRTGTGNIDIAASGDFELLDTLLPGTVYTAGKASAAPTASDATTIAYGKGYYYNVSTGRYTYGESFLITNSTNASDAGDITINVLGDVIGIEAVYDTLASGSATTASGLTSRAGGYIGQMYTAWLLDDPNDSSIAWYVNYGSFDQGILSVGGNIAITAGGDIRDLGVSTATTAYLDASNTTHVTGGGNLSVTAGGSIYSGSYYVGIGTGTIRAGGEIASDIDYQALNNAHVYAVPTVLAVQYSTIDVAARGSVDIGGVYDPTYLWTQDVVLGTQDSPVANYVISNGDFAASPNYVPYITSMNGDSEVYVQSASGDVSFNTLEVEADLIASSHSYGVAATTSLLLPSTVELISFDGSVEIAHGGGLYPSDTGTLQLLAKDSIDLYVASEASGTVLSPMEFPILGNVYGYTLELLDYPVGTGILPTASDPTLTNALLLTENELHDEQLLEARTDKAETVHIYALTGDITDGTTLQSGQSFEKDDFLDRGGEYVYELMIPGKGLSTGAVVYQLSLITNTPTSIYAGGNITDLPFYGENYSTSDITSVIAGGNITYSSNGAMQSAIIELAGPGTLYVEAGGDIKFQSQRLSGVNQTGIVTIGNSIDDTAYPITSVPANDTWAWPYNTTTVLGSFGNPYLPEGGADIEVVYGVKYGMDTADFISTYIKAADGNAASATYLDDLNTFLKKQKKTTEDVSADEAWVLFEALSPLEQKLFVTEVYFDILNQTGLDYNNASSDYYHKYARGYEAINTLFPSSWGYTANALTGGTNGANALVKTGTLDIRGSRIQTGQGGNISILGPGGRLLVGSASASVATDPASEGIITFESGNINIFTDESILVAQSRIMTEQGGNLVVWSSNGDINAGKGAKTSVSNPPPVYACDEDWYCVVDARGIVTGAGIASLQTLVDSPLGDVDMIAPRGTVDAGAAGIRVSGNLNIAAMYVANAFNIEVKGTTIGVPTLTTNLNLATVSNAATEATSILDSMKAKEPQNTIDVEVTGYGGLDSDNPERCIPSKTNNCGTGSHR